MDVRTSQNTKITIPKMAIITNMVIVPVMARITYIKASVELLRSAPMSRHIPSANPQIVMKTLYAYSALPYLYHPKEPMINAVYP